LDLHALAALVDAFYREAEDRFTAHGGRVVKFVGDGCLAVFEPGDALAALDAVEELRDRVHDLGARHGVELALGANVHLSTVAEGSFGLSGTYDVLGAGVIHTFRMGGGAGLRISERVYRKLPSDRRPPWRKHQPPATYTKDAAP
jgi:class 3 adenylate cyclase